MEDSNQRWTKLGAFLQNQGTFFRFSKKNEGRPHPPSPSCPPGNAVWYNPPYSINVKTNIGKVFFKLLHKHFLKTHKFYKIFNKNTVKLSYSSMRNMASIIASYNNTILRPNIQDYGCNCRKKNEFPMHNKCLTPNIIYEASY